jgi:hypothetical protein
MISSPSPRQSRLPKIIRPTMPRQLDSTGSPQLPLFVFGVFELGICLAWQRLTERSPGISGAEEGSYLALFIAK